MVLNPASALHQFHPVGDVMTSALLVVFTTAVVLTVAVLYRKRKPTVAESTRNLGIEFQRGVRDSVIAAKDAAVDVRNAVHDATK